MHSHLVHWVPYNVYPMGQAMRRFKVTEPCAALSDASFSAARDSGKTADGADSLVKKKIRLGSSGGVVMRTVQERGHNGGEGDKHVHEDYPSRASLDTDGMGCVSYVST